MSNSNLPNQVAESGTEKPAKVSGPERRRTVRRTVSASVEMIELLTHTRLTGRATDISEGGCYVDVLSPFAANTAVRLRLSSEGHSFTTPAVVTYSLPGMGMGLMFTNVSEEQAAVLRDWIAKSSGEPAPAPVESQGPILFEESPSAASAPANLHNGVLELIDILRRKQILTEFEAAPLKKKITG